MSSVPPLPQALERVIHEFSRLPTIGRKSAQRLALHLLKMDELQVTQLAQALSVLRQEVRLCNRCGFLAEGPLCSVCLSPRRDHGLLCVVEEAADVLALERTGLHPGVYHVLHGRIAPLSGILPEDLNLKTLIERAETGSPVPIREVIAATNPTADGDATALYLHKVLQPFGIRVTRLAYGIANNSAVETADETTLARALEGRREL